MTAMTLNDVRAWHAEKEASHTKQIRDFPNDAEIIGKLKKQHTDCIEAIDAHLSQPAQAVDVDSPCYVGIVASRVCQRGTKSCVIDHEPSETVNHRAGPQWDAIDAAIKGLNGEDFRIITESEFQALTTPKDSRL